jgi:hypothetical protein
MKRLCQYKDILGKPNEGIHSIRIFNLAVVDILLTFICAFVFSKLSGVNFFKVLICLILLGIFLHWFFCVDTALNKMIYKLYKN